MTPTPRSMFAAALVLAAPLSSCASGPSPEPEPAPSLDPAREALLLEARTRLDFPVRVVFDWYSNEAGTRASGRGVARIAPPDRVRLDLFLENGEIAAKAAMIGRELRLPDGAPEEILPPPDFMWGALGFFRPILGSTLIEVESFADGSLRLRYRLDDRRELRYRAAGSDLVEVEMTESGDVVQRIRTEHDDEDFPKSARYRNMAEFRELRIERAAVERVESFPTDIWDPRVAPRGR